MDDKIVLNEYERPAENDLERTFVTLPPFSSIRANAFENVRNEYRPIAIEEYFIYSQQTIATTCDLPKEDSWIQHQEDNAIGLGPVSFLQWPNNFHENMSNSFLTCNVSAGENLDLP
ncbi:zinc finger protein 16 [Trichonephila clavata]|uniref:Zinc finger protein 16 n=1 Tax=Trichonephila clavata TaxID=2740835 RepID=A0A8X6LLN7_TRICU|nr:zinc finger protein 16 [Trichonephila clavata]